MNHLINDRPVSKWWFKFTIWRYKFNKHAYSYMLVSGQPIYRWGKTFMIKPDNNNKEMRRWTK